MHAGDMAWVLPELVWHLEDLRVGMSLPEPLHRAARVEVREGRRSPGPAATSCSPAIRGATSCVDGADDPTSSSGATSTTGAGSCPATSTAAFFTPERARAAPTATSRSTSSATCSRRPTGSTRSRRRSTSRRRRSCTGLLVVEDRVSMAHSLEVRVPFLDNELVDVARRIPSQPQARGRRRQAHPARARCAGCCPPEILDEAEAGLQPAGRVVVPRPDDGADPRAAARPRGRSSAATSGPRRSRAMLDEHVAGRRNHRLLIWSLLCFEWWNRLFVDGEPSRPPQRLARRVARRAAPGRTLMRSARRPARATRSPRSSDARRLRVVVAPLAASRGSDGAAASAARSSGGTTRSRTCATRSGPTGSTGTGASRSSTDATGPPTARAFDHVSSRSARIPVLRQLAPYAAFLWAGLALRRLLLLLRRRAARRDALLAGSSCRCSSSPARRSSSSRTAATRGCRRATRARGGWHAYSDVPPGERGSRRGGGRGAPRRRSAAGPTPCSAAPTSSRTCRALDGVLPYPFDVDGWRARAEPPTTTSCASCTRRTTAHYKGTRYVERRRSSGCAPRACRSSSCSSQGVPNDEARRDLRAGGRRRRPVPDRRVRALRDRGHGARQAGGLLPQPALRALPS